MFRYVLVHASEQPTLAAGQPTSDLLSPAEIELLSGLHHLPRRRKWLLGRKAAKCLVREMSAPPAPAESDIGVLNQVSGEPFVDVEGQGQWPRAISLSHRRDIGMAAAPEDRTARIGADVEIVEARDPALVRQFFTDAEAEWVAAAGVDRDEVVARMWSAKEAVLKLVGLGLRLDTRCVEVCPDGEPFSSCPAGWRPVGVKAHGQLAAGETLEGLRVMWRRETGHLLTVAVARATRSR